VTDFQDLISDDYEGFDGNEAVTVTMLDGTQVSVTNANSTQLTKRQTAAYGLVGLDCEVRSFSLPVAELNGETVEQDSTITDAQSRIWVVKAAELRTMGTRVFCACQLTRTSTPLDGTSNASYLSSLICIDMM
jgi:hypothetical protein